MSGDNPPRLLHLGGARRKSGVGGGDLLRMDQGLAVKAEGAALDAGGGEPVGVREVEMHPVERGQAVGPRRQQHQAERWQQRQPVGAVADA